MLLHCQQKLPLFDKSKIFEVATGVIEVAETDKGGAGTVSFSVKGTHLSLKLGQQPISWLQNKKCADGAFIIFEGNDLHLHIVELKSSLTHKEWKKVKSQFEGMLLNCLSILGVIALNKFKSINCHVAFNSENLSQAASASPYLLKPLVGAGALPPLAAADFNQGVVSLLGYGNVALNKIVRDASGNGSFAIS